MRMFVAVDIPEGLKEKIIEIEKEIQSLADVKATESENLHYTLKFLGDVEEKESENVVKKIEVISKQFKKFKVHTKGVGFFGSPDFIKVVWTGCEEGKETLINISKKLEEELKYIKEDEYDFHPHLTIARPRNVENKKKFLEKLEEMKNLDFGEFIVDKIILKQSKLSAKGPEYSDFKVFELGD